jgi:hypothetical protein
MARKRQIVLLWNIFTEDNPGWVDAACGGFPVQIAPGRVIARIKK